MKRVLVTGASGFIGQQCLPSLAARGYEVHAAYCLKAPEENLTNTHWHRVDLLNSERAFELMAKIQPTHFLHFAWFVEPGKYWHSVENIRWVQSSLDLLRAFLQHGGQRVVIAGTCAEYDWKYGFCSEEITPLIPKSLYGVCKHSLEGMLGAFAKQAGLSSAWGRIFFPYGPHEHPERLIPSVIRSLLYGKPVRCSHGNQIRDFLHVKDVADAFIALLESEVRGPVNIASGQPIAVKDIIGLLTQRLGHEKLVKFGSLPLAEGEPPLLVADVRRLGDEVGWRPKISLEQGLVATIQWWKDAHLQGAE
jgi:nucleoside-diphosphate-sugar epimerase